MNPIASGIFHTGSRNYGAKIARYYQKLAGETCHDAPYELAYLQGDSVAEYTCQR